MNKEEQQRNIELALQDIKYKWDEANKDIIIKVDKITYKVADIQRQFTHEETYYITGNNLRRLPMNPINQDKFTSFWVKGERVNCDIESDFDRSIRISKNYDKTEWAVYMSWSVSEHEYNKYFRNRIIKNVV